MKGAMLDFVLANKKRLMGNMKVKNNLVCIGYEMVEFRIIRTIRRVCSELSTLDFKKNRLWPLQRSSRGSNME